jgi:hypothetical protein
MSNPKDRKPPAPQPSARTPGPPKPAMVTDADGVAWTVRAEKRRQAILSFDRSDHRVDAPVYLVFTSELGQRRRSRDPVEEDWPQLSSKQLRDLLQQGLGMPPVSR